MSSAPLREVAPRATLHRPSLSRAQIQVRAISEVSEEAVQSFFILFESEFGGDVSSADTIPTRIRCADGWAGFQDWLL